MKTFIYSAIFALLMAGQANAFGLNDLMDKAGKIAGQLPKTEQKQDNPNSIPVPAAAPSSDTKQPSNGQLSDDERRKARDKGWAEDKRKMDMADKEQADKEQKSKLTRDEEERKFIEKMDAEDQKRREAKERKAQEEQRKWEEESQALDQRYEDNQRKEAEEQKRLAEEMERKAKVDGAARGLIQAPFNQNWGAESFSSSKKQNVTKNHHVEIFSYQLEGTPPGTGDVAFLVCEGSGLQKVTWLSTKYDAWTVGPRFKELKAILTDKYGPPSEDFGLSRVYWPGASGTDVILITNQYSNQNMDIVIFYDGPKLGACLSKLEKKGKAGF